MSTMCIHCSAEEYIQSIFVVWSGGAPNLLREFHNQLSYSIFISENVGALMVDLIRQEHTQRNFGIVQNDESRIYDRHSK